MKQNRDEIQTELDALRTQRGKAAANGKPFQRLTNAIIAAQSRLEAINDLEHELQIRARTAADKQAKAERAAMVAEREVVRDGMVGDAARAEAACKVLVAALEGIDLGAARLRKITAELKEPRSGLWQYEEMRRQMGFRIAAVFERVSGVSGRYGGFTFARLGHISADFWCAQMRNIVNSKNATKPNRKARNDG